MQNAELPITYGRIADLPADPLLRLRAQYEAHGDLSVFQDGHRQYVFAFGPEHNKRILSDPDTFHSCFFVTRGSKRSAQRRLSSGLLSMNGAEHRLHRRRVMEPFKPQAFAGYVEPISRMIGDLLDGWAPGETRDLQDEMVRFMLRTTSSILFGFDQPDRTERIGQMTHDWVELSHEVGASAFGFDDVGYEDYDRLLALAGELESEIADLLRMRRESQGDGHDVLSILVRLHDEDGALGEAELIGHTALLFAAAHLTTSHTLTWTLLLLAQHPEVASALCAEIDDVLGDRPGRLDDLGQLPLLDRVVKESMRVLPASAYVQRLSTRPVEFGPFSLPQGTVFVFSQFITHHMHELYEEPERFLPDRWLSINPTPYTYLPFGAGPRMCIGGPLALVIVKLTIPAILQRFRLEVVPDAAINAAVVATMLAPTGAVPMRVNNRSAPFRTNPTSGNIHELVEFSPAAVV
ncbi:MAG: cytochrome P450 [Pirellulales bacterium]